jgi:hypothetical protein
MMPGLEAGVSCPGRPGLPGQGRAPVPTARRRGSTRRNRPVPHAHRSSGRWAIPGAIGMTVS